MKKTIFSIMLAATLVGAVAIGWQINQNQGPLSDVMLANIEALSSIELPENPNTCEWNPRGGQCYRQGFKLKMCGEYMFYQCEYTGLKSDNCINPC